MKRWRVDGLSLLGPLFTVALCAPGAHIASSSDGVGGLPPGLETAGRVESRKPAGPGGTSCGRG